MCRQIFGLGLYVYLKSPDDPPPCLFGFYNWLRQWIRFNNKGISDEAVAQIVDSHMVKYRGKIRRRATIFQALDYGDTLHIRE
jgi:hypothetical protein